MSAPKYCACGRKILVFINRRRNPNARTRGLRRGRRIPDHDLCNECWRRLTHVGVRA